MFSFVGDTVLDPFGGTGTTSVAAIHANRNSVYNELDPEYFSLAHDRIRTVAAQGHLLYPDPVIEIETHTRAAYSVSSDAIQCERSDTANRLADSSTQGSR